MPAIKPREELNEDYLAVKERLDNAQLRPRARMALRMYALGAVPSIAAAAEATGMNNAYLGIIASSKPGMEYIDKMQEKMDITAITTTDLIQQLGRKAVVQIANHMENASSESLRLKAAIDLADRSPETSKTQKLQVESFSIDGKDAKAIAEALVQGQQVHRTFQHLAEGNFDKVTQELPSATPSDSNT